MNFSSIWKRNFRKLYDAIPSQRIGRFEIIKINYELFLIEHGDDLVVWMAACQEDESKLYLPFYQSCGLLSEGNVLIGGLGLGCDLLNIVSIDEVQDVVAIEKHQEVIDLVWPYIPHDKAKLVRGDVNDFLSITDNLFDIVYFDINPGGMGSFPETSDKLKDLSKRCLKPGGKVMFWEEFI